MRRFIMISPISMMLWKLKFIIVIKSFGFENVIVKVFINWMKTFLELNICWKDPYKGVEDLLGPRMRRKRS